MNNAPTISTIVENDRIGEGIEDAQHEVIKASEWAKGQIQTTVSAGMREAYRLGVTDGFQQGALADNRVLVDKVLQKFDGRDVDSDAMLDDIRVALGIEVPNV